MSSVQRWIGQIGGVFLACLLVYPCIAEPLTLPLAVAAEIDVEGETTRLAITLSQEVPFKAYLDRPDRAIVDLPMVNFQLSAETGRKRQGLMAYMRYGVFARQRSRMVIDLAQPARIARSEIRPGKIEGTSILTLEFIRASRDAVAVSEPVATASLVTKAKTESPSADRRPLIVIDPGHGGNDPGARTKSGLFEKDIVVAFALKLRDRLKERYRVALTRDRDVFVALSERVTRARSSKADLLISIHADSIASGEVRGLTIYTGSKQASDSDSEKLAERENSVDATGLAPDTEDDVADILQDLTGRETRGLSHRFARKLAGELEPVAKLNHNPTRQASFYVLRSPDVPSVLVELGYLSSARDIGLLTSDDWRARATDAMANAIDRFFAAKLAGVEEVKVSP